jgi:ABC-type dipeptide/oligopeptide/nickel transport system permease subunit
VRRRASLELRIGAGIVAFAILFALFGPVLAPHDPYTSDFVRGASPERTPVGPSAAFWFGADRVYRDEFARLAAGGRFALGMGLAATAIATAVGGAVGVVAGWFEGSDGVRIPWCTLACLGAGALFALDGHSAAAVASALAGGAMWIAGRAAPIPAFRAGPRVNLDAVLMRAVDVGLALPFLLLVMAIGAALDHTTPATVVLVLGLTGWLGTARVVRAKTMQVRALDFVLAARALGRSTPAILWRHILPNVRGLLTVVATLSVAQMILAESVLGYLGVGLAPPKPTWGRMLLEGQDYLLAGPWMVAAPASAIVLAALGFHLLGEGLRDALDASD